MSALVRRSASILVLAVVAVLASACAPKAPAPAPTATVSRAALPMMERVALGANACWFKSGDPSFRPYRLAPELNSFSGRPRILLVKAHSPESRPLLVVQAEGDPGRLEAFGPLMSDRLAGRIAGDVNRWASGRKGC